MLSETKTIGIIESIEDEYVKVNFHGDIIKFEYPSAFSTVLELEDELIHDEFKSFAEKASLKSFQRLYLNAINTEIAYLKLTGGKRYRLIDGERIPVNSDGYLYAFDSDAEYHFPVDTQIKIWLKERVVLGYIVSCEDYTVLIRTKESLGEMVESIEFTADQWQLLEALCERIGELDSEKNSIAYQVACDGKKHFLLWNGIKRGQGNALGRATSESVTFIWGPPGTGKTETLANIAIEHINCGRRVLMLSFSNVSVDGATLRLAKKADYPDGTIIRYGYPKSQELLNNEKLYSYQFILKKYPQLADEHRSLITLKQHLKKKDPRRVEINKKLSKIHDKLIGLEKELINECLFVATTVSKATVDEAIYSQQFDVVIFDEASMAYVPQVVFSAGLAKSFFVCLGDFCQLPAIVQNDSDDRLSRDIFEYTGITYAVEHDIGHEWLVMLDVQYRMHEEIADFVSTNIYHNMLKTSEKIIEDREEIALCHPCPGNAISMVDLSGMYSVCIKTMDGSRINLFSAMVCIRLAESVVENNEVAIITPYNAQSRLILSMIRDIQEYDKRWLRVSCATVHQFQGSEKSIVIYDAVDCYRMPYPGTLLTSVNNDTADRLFNVAITRSIGKFILVANIDYFLKKKISKKLFFTKTMNYILHSEKYLADYFVMNELLPLNKYECIMYFDNRETSWEQYLIDINLAEERVQIDVPDVMELNDEGFVEFTKMLISKKESGVDIVMRIPEEIELPEEFQQFVVPKSFVTNPTTIIDRKVIWFGHPYYSADFISEGRIIQTREFPCARFMGKHAARIVQAFLG